VCYSVYINMLFNAACITLFLISCSLRGDVRESSPEVNDTLGLHLILCPIMTIFYSPTLVAQQKERKIDEKLGTT